MSVMYSMIAFVASAVKGHSGVSFDKHSGSAVDRTFGTFNSFGTIMFAFGGQIVMPEIQVQPPPTPPPSTPPVPISSTHSLSCKCCVSFGLHRQSLCYSDVVSDLVLSCMRK